MEPQTIKALFVDIDGTLYSHTDNRVPSSAHKALAMLKEAGVRTYACTGRCMEEIHNMHMEDVALDGWMTMNGAYCFDQDGFAYSCPLDRHDVAVLVETCQSYDYPCMFLEKDRMYISRDDEEVRRSQEAIHTPMPEICDPKRAMMHTVYMAIPYIPEEDWKSVMGLLHHVKATRWTDLAVDVIHADCDKARAIEETCRHYGWKKEEIAAIGDGPNDLSMLSAAGISIAMDNGCTEAKQAADWITDDIDHDGFYKAVCRLLNRRENV